MIQLHRLNGTSLSVNTELIESIEGQANTVLVLVTGNRIVVKEGMEEVVQKVIEYRKAVYVNAPYLPEFLKASGKGDNVCH